MDRVLIYANRKSDLMVWDATGDKQRQAFYALFEHLNKEFRVYSDIEQPGDSPRSRLLYRYYQSAKEGDMDSAMRLLAARRSYEYEEWDLVGLKKY